MHPFPLGKEMIHFIGWRVCLKKVSAQWGNSFFLFVSHFFSPSPVPIGCASEGSHLYTCLKTILCLALKVLTYQCLKGRNVWEITVRILQLRKKNGDSCAWCTRGEPSTLVCLQLMCDGFPKRHELPQRESGYWVSWERNEVRLGNMWCVAGFVVYSLYSWSSESQSCELRVQMMLWIDRKHAYHCNNIDLQIMMVGFFGGRTEGSNCTISGRESRGIPEIGCKEAFKEHLAIIITNPSCVPSAYRELMAEEYISNHLKAGNICGRGTGLLESFILTEGL